MKKHEALAEWKSLTPNQPILKHMDPIPYKATGSSYGACGIRIDGNPDFVNAVLSRLQDIIAGENHVTRLELARTRVDGSKLGKQFCKAAKDAEVCYIRLHMRGEQGAAASAFFDKELHAPTKQYAAEVGMEL